MRDLFRNLRQLLAQGQDTVLVTIVSSSGAVPRGIGARMLVTAKGRAYGTIGGGAVEYRSELLAKEVLVNKASRTEHFRLQNGTVVDLDMACGGEVDVSFCYISGGDEAVMALADRVERCYAEDQDFWLLCALESGNLSLAGDNMESGCPMGKDDTTKLGDKPQCIELDGTVYYCEPVKAPDKVYVFGGGHVAQALVPALASVGFTCVVLDDRAEFVKKELFPQAEKTLLIDPKDLSGIVEKISARDYVCIMTHGHKDDFEIQRQIMKTPARYIGVIGSANKQRLLTEKLLALGFTKEDFHNVVSPIGLDLGGRTPAEIAISITAQLIMVRAGKGPGAIWEKMKKENA